MSSSLATSSPAARTILKHAPSVRDAIEEHLIEILIDEIGHVSFQRLSMGRAGLTLTRKAGGPMSRLASITTMALCAALVLGARDAPAVRAQSGAHATAATAPPADAIVGEWWTEGKQGRIRFVRSPDDTYSGVLVGGTDPGADTNNKDPALRKRRLLGTVLIWHLRPDDGAYVDGYVYNPRNGETYRMKAELTGTTTLKVRGYLGISLLGQSQTWTRAN